MHKINTNKNNNCRVALACATSKDELQGTRLSVTSSCVKHDGCLLSQQFVAWPFCKYIINNTLCSIALFNLGPHSFYLRIEGSIYTV
jgi:hypothetical protein